jgi:hypothetical protein
MFQILYEYYYLAYACRNFWSTLSFLLSATETTYRNKNAYKLRKLLLYNFLHASFYLLSLRFSYFFQNFLVQYTHSNHTFFQFSQPHKTTAEVIHKSVFREMTPPCLATNYPKLEAASFSKYTIVYTKSYCVTFRKTVPLIFTAIRTSNSTSKIIIFYIRLNFRLLNRNQEGKLLWTEFNVFRTVHLRIILVGKQLDAQFFYNTYIYLNPLHVSSNYVFILKRTVVWIQLLV